MDLIDTHTHLNFEAFVNDWQEIVRRAVASGVEKMIVVGTNVELSLRAVEMAEQNEALFAAIGIHPHHARGYVESHPEPDSGSSSSKADFDVCKIPDQARNDMKRDLSIIQELADHERVVAIGEVGLDHHVYKNSKRYKINNTEEEWERLREIQGQIFRRQIEIAANFKKPLIIHSRDAGDGVLKAIQEWMEEANDAVNGVFHCFEGSKKYLKKILKAGFFVSFTGNITYSHDRAEVAKEVPIDKLLIETDCPYMTPNPLRGKRNEPSHVKIVASKHARDRLVQIDEVADQTTTNAYELFKLAD